MRRANVEMRRRKISPQIREVIAEKLSRKVTEELCGPIRDRLYDVWMELYVEISFQAGKKVRT